MGGYFGDAWNLSRVAASSVAGGLVAQVSGGKFKDGAFLSAMTAGARYLYNKALGYVPTFKGGKGQAGPGGVYTEGSGVPNGPIVIGTNYGKLVGNFFKDFFKQSGPLSKTANLIPGMNSLAKLHDTMQIAFGVPGSTLRSVGNVPAMIPAAVINYTALMDGLPAHVLSQNRER